jgi:hypothetical protein
MTAESLERVDVFRSLFSSARVIGPTDSSTVHLSSAELQTAAAACMEKGWRLLENDGVLTLHPVPEAERHIHVSRRALAYHRAKVTELEAELATSEAQGDLLV